MFMLKKLAHLTLQIFVQFAVVILPNEQSTSIEINGIYPQIDGIFFSKL